MEVVFDVESSSVGPVIERMLDARKPAGEPTARTAYRNLNQRLKRDGVSGVIVEQTQTAVRTLIEIPGVREEAKEKLPSLWETGTVDGTPTGVGGRLLDPEWVPVRIADSGTVVNCEARPATAIEIARHLLTAPIRAAGKGKWVHDDDKGWRLERVQNPAVRIAGFPRGGRLGGRNAGAVRRHRLGTDGSSDRSSPWHRIFAIRGSRNEAARNAQQCWGSPTTGSVSGRGDGW